jgi:SAM-dependent methyltransferase
MNEGKLYQIRDKYNLSYHVDFLRECDNQCRLKGKRVVEIGGSLPKELVFGCFGVKQWIAIEDLNYWDEITETTGETQPELNKPRPIKELTSWPDNSEYEIFVGKVEEINPNLYGHFDLVFSIACFEHIHTIGLALDRMWSVLKSGGKLFTMFSPIWSAHDGHHLPNIVDRNGNKFTFANSPIPPWGHLQFSPSEMSEHLMKHTDFKTAHEMVYYIYHSPHINRLFTEDYVRYFQNSKFTIKKLIATFPSKMPHGMQSLLTKLYPKNSSFSNNGILALLEKP